MEGGDGDLKHHGGGRGSDSGLNDNLGRKQASCAGIFASLCSHAV